MGKTYTERSTTRLRSLKVEYNALSRRLDKLEPMSTDDYNGLSSSLNDMEELLCYASCIPGSVDLWEIESGLFFIGNAMDEYKTIKPKSEDNAYRRFMGKSANIERAIKIFDSKVNDIKMRLSEGQNPEEIAEALSKSLLDKKPILKLIDKIKSVEAA